MSQAAPIERTKIRGRFEEVGGEGEADGREVGHADEPELISMLFTAR